MYNRITPRTALAGRLFLCPEIAVHHARPPPVSVQIINPLTTKGGIAYVLSHLPALRGELRPRRTL